MFLKDKLFQSFDFLQKVKQAHLKYIQDTKAGTKMYGTFTNKNDCYRYLKAS